MKRLVRQIPNTLTCANLACGFLAILMTMNSDSAYLYTTIFIIIAAAFDFADGLAARLLKAYSPIGKDLDSLADLVSFGVAPSVMLFAFINQLNYNSNIKIAWWPSLPALIPILAIPVCSALRLAKFNIDNRQKTSFIGLPVPAHAILLSSLICAIVRFFIGNSEWNTQWTIDSGVVYAAGLLTFALLSSLLLVSRIHMFSLKFTSLAWKGNQMRYCLIAIAIALTVAFGYAGIAATILIYIFMSVIRRG